MRFPGPLAILLFSLAAHGEIIDRIALSVGNRVITQSDLERQIRVIAFQNGSQPDFSSVNKHTVAGKMIEQKLIQREVENSRYPLPLPTEIAPLIEEFKKQYFKSEEEYQHALAAYKITAQDLVDVLTWERTLLRFIEIRFETGVQATPQEAEDFGRQRNLSPDAAEHALISERANEQLDQWLRDVRRRTDVIVHEEVLQ